MPTAVPSSDTTRCSSFVYPPRYDRHSKAFRDITAQGQLQNDAAVTGAHTPMNDKPGACWQWDGRETQQGPRNMQISISSKDPRTAQSMTGLRCMVIQRSGRKRRSIQKASHTGQSGQPRIVRSQLFLDTLALSYIYCFSFKSLAFIHKLSLTTTKEHILIHDRESV